MRAKNSNRLLTDDTNCKKMSRSANFTEQENLLIAEIMGEEFGDFGLSRHKLDKHKFNSSKFLTLSVCVYFEFDLKFIKCQKLLSNLSIGISLNVGLNST